VVELCWYPAYNAIVSVCRGRDKDRLVPCITFNGSRIYNRQLGTMTGNFSTTDCDSYMRRDSGCEDIYLLSRILDDDDDDDSFKILSLNFYFKIIIF